MDKITITYKGHDIEITNWKYNTIDGEKILWEFDAKFVEDGLNNPNSMTKFLIAEQVHEKLKAENLIENDNGNQQNI